MCHLVDLRILVDREMADIHCCTSLELQTEIGAQNIDGAHDDNGRCD